MRNISEYGKSKTVSSPELSNGKSSQRFFNICYLTAISVATFGWVSAFGWFAVKLAKLLDCM